MRISSAACEPATEYAPGLGAATPFDCWTCATSCEISCWPLDEPGLYWPAPKKMSWPAVNACALSELAAAAALSSVCRIAPDECGAPERDASPGRAVGRLLRDPRLARALS